MNEIDKRNRVCQARLTNENKKTSTTCLRADDVNETESCHPNHLVSGRATANVSFSSFYEQFSFTLFLLTPGVAVLILYYAAIACFHLTATLVMRNTYQLPYTFCTIYGGRY